MKCASSIISTADGRKLSSPVTSDATSIGAAEDRRHLEAPQDVRFAVLHGADAGAEEADAQNADDQHHRHHLDDRAALLGVKQLRKDEEENQREQVIEEDDRPVAERQLDD